MAFSYSGDPSSSPRDAVRFLIGDTDPSAPYLTDGEVNFLLAQYDGNAGRAAIDAVMSIIATLASAGNETVGNVTISNSDNLSRFEGLLSLLRSRFNSSATVRCFAGGISRADKAFTRQNPDRVVPYFSRNDPAPSLTSNHISSDPKSLGDWEYGA